MNMMQPAMFELENEALVVFPPTEDPRDETIQSIHFRPATEQLTVVGFNEVSDDSKL